jgi:CBS-domain-containing membrane protein
MTMHKSSKCSVAKVSCNDFANEAWLYMENHQLEQLDVFDGEEIIGIITKARLDTFSRETRLKLDVRDLI